MELLWLYAYGRPAQTLKIEDESAPRRVATLVFLDGGPRDPLAEPEPKPRRLPPTLLAVAEVPFEMDDIDLPPREGT